MCSPSSFRSLSITHPPLPFSLLSRLVCSLFAPPPYIFDAPCSNVRGDFSGPSQRRRPGGRGGGERRHCWARGRVRRGPHGGRTRQPPLRVRHRPVHGMGTCVLYLYLFTTNSCLLPPLPLSPLLLFSLDPPPVLLTLPSPVPVLRFGNVLHHKLSVRSDRDGSGLRQTIGAGVNAGLHRLQTEGRVVSADDLAEARVSRRRQQPFVWRFLNTRVALKPSPLVSTSTARQCFFTLPLSFFFWC